MCDFFLRVINTICTQFLNLRETNTICMSELEEYKHCLEEIERYRGLREQLLKDISELTEKLAAANAQNNGEAATEIKKQIDAKYLRDERFGAAMHELAIRRNLLEP